MKKIYLMPLALLAACAEPATQPEGTETAPADVVIAANRLPADAPAPVAVNWNGKDYTLRYVVAGGASFNARPFGDLAEKAPAPETAKPAPAAEGQAAEPAVANPLPPSDIYHLDVLRVGGAADKAEAVAVYLHFCRNLDTVASGWAEQPVPFDRATGEYEFSFPQVCPPFAPAA